jgi:hypothetical protein
MTRIFVGGNFPAHTTVDSGGGTYTVDFALFAQNPEVTFVGPGTYNVNVEAALFSEYTVEATKGAVLNLTTDVDFATVANLVVDGASTISIDNEYSALTAINASFTGSGGGTLNFTPGKLALFDTKPVVTGFAANDQIDFGRAPTAGDKIVYDPTSSDGGSLTLEDSTGKAIGSVNLVGHYVQGDFALGPYGIDFVCFLEGTLIATPGGDVPVETLRAGDLVTTVTAGETAAKPVRWVGHRTIKSGDLPETDAYPVRIAADAFGPDVPRRDLLVTPEHCILVNGGLIPARMLVNGRSIILDRGIASYTYYHVELEQHGILLAEGLTAESYLDTGNRGNFANAGVVSMNPQFAVNEGHKNWADAAAPLTVDPASAEPVWRMLEARAQALGVPKISPDPVLTSDPELHLVTAGGAVIRPIRNTGGRYFFMLPAGEHSLRLVSRTARPSDTIGPYYDDRRDLGVLVGEIALHEGRGKAAIRTHLDAEHLDGWFAQETAAHRWTNGKALLPVNLANPHVPAILEIQIVNAGPYQVAPAAVAIAA